MLHFNAPLNGAFFSVRNGANMEHFLEDSLVAWSNCENHRAIYRRRRHAPPAATSPSTCPQAPRRFLSPFGSIVSVTMCYIAPLCALMLFFCRCTALRSATAAPLQRRSPFSSSTPHRVIPLLPYRPYRSLACGHESHLCILFVRWGNQPARAWAARSLLWRSLLWRCDLAGRRRRRCAACHRWRRRWRHSWWRWRRW